MKKIVVFLLLIVTLFSFAACKKKDPTPAYYTVRFDVSYLPPNEEISDSRMLVEAGSTVTPPTITAKPTPGTAIIWTADLTSKTPYDESLSVNADMTLYAVEVPKSYSITYDIPMGKNSYKNPSSYDGTKEITLYPVTSLPFGGYVFIKWYVPGEKETEIKSIPVGTKGDIILRAEIAQKPYTVIYYSEDRDATYGEYVFGETMELPTLTRAGYTFLGWQAHNDEKIVVNALTPELVEGNQDAFFTGIVNITLDAKWRKDE